MDLAVTKNWKMKDFPLKCQKKPENITVTVWNLTDSIRDQEDDLIRAVRNDDVEGIEDFLGYEISDVVLEELDSRLREVMNQMPDEEYSLFLEKYHLVP